MREFWDNLKNWQKIMLGLAPIIAIAVAIVLVAILMNPRTNVNIRFSEKTNIPGAEMIQIRKRLADVIRDNTADYSDSTIYDGVARDYNEYAEDGTTTASFVVDFDAIKESYAVDVLWPDPDDGSPNIIVSCPLADSKYPETPCATETNSTSEIIGYLPYEGTTDAGDKYEVNGEYTGGKLYLEIETNGDAVTALTATKKWMSLLGFDPDDYLFYVVNGSYVQANHSKTNDANVNEKLPYFIPNVFYVYPVTDATGNVESIQADIAGCTDYQTDSAEEEINNYLNRNGISYPVEFEYCTD